MARAGLAVTRAHYETFPFVSGGEPRIRHWARRLKKPLPNGLLAGRTVLDLGCGSGEITHGLLRRGAQVVGVDLTSAATRATRSLNPAAAVVQANALRLPFATAAFDLSVSIGVLHHTPDARSGLAEMVRVTRPGGRVLIMLYSRWTPYHLVYTATAPLRRVVPVTVLNRLPKWILAVVRLAVAAQGRTRLPNEQLRRLLADQLWTPCVTFHSLREIHEWARVLQARVVWRKGLLCHANLVALEC